MAVDDVRHPDAERLAEYAEGVLDVGARAEIERHLADCADCRAVVMETMRFLESFPARAQAPTVVPFRRRRWVTGVAVGLAAAAALVLAIRVAQPTWLDRLFGARGDRPELQELIAAVANEPTRPVEGRLSGGFKYAPPPSPTRGAGDHDVSPDVRIAAAKIEKRAATHRDPSMDAARGAAMLVQGSLDAAIIALESAVNHQPQNPFFQNDLAAALIARAARFDRHDDWFKAVRAADSALAANPRSVEARFNRALALEGHGQLYEARAAWEKYLEMDTTSLWAGEARRRLQALKDRLAAPRTIELHPVGELEPPSLPSLQFPPFLKRPFESELYPGLTRDRSDFPASFWFDTPRTMCSATLVGPNAVLLAAHCIHSTDRVSIDLGSRTHVTGTCVQHDQFDPDPQRLTNDLAICKLDSRVTNIVFERVSTAPVDAKRVLLLSGFGCDGANVKKVFRTAFAGIDREPTAADDHIIARGLTTGCVATNKLFIRCGDEQTASLCEGDSGGATFLLSSPSSIGSRVQVAVNSFVDSSHRSGLTSLSTASAKAFLDAWSAKGVEICGVTNGLQAQCRPPT